MEYTMYWKSSVSSISCEIMMARLSIVLIIVVLMYVLAEEEHYSDRHDHLDVRGLLENKALREEYYNCFMEIAPCKTPLDQQRILAVFSEAYQTQCRKCTQKQIENMNIVSDWYTKNEPEKWQLMIAKTVEYMKKNAGHIQ